MRGERRDGVVQSSSVANPQAGMSNRTSAKPYVIAKRAVWEAFQQVKANRGAAGVDEETIAMLEQNLSKNLYKLWNRMSSGSYFPPPVKQVENSEGKGRHEKAGHPYCVGSDCANRGQADHRAEAGSDVPCGFVWISTRKVGQAGDSRHSKTVLAIRLGG
jgi:hypothetical protein